jgi:isocitrate/isopropylmalate dehydrogenase
MAAVLSAGLLLRHNGAPEAATAVDMSVDNALAAGIRTPDLGGTLSTRDVGEWLADAVASNLS